MNNRILHITLFLLVLVSRAIMASATPQDTVYFYNTWEQMLEKSPVALIVNPIVHVYSPYEFYIETGVEDLDEQVVNDHIAVSLGDSIWLVNSDYLRRDFKGDAKKLYGFVPVYFNDKVAFVDYVNQTEWAVSVNDYLFGEVDVDGMTSSAVVDHYYVDFIQHRVLKVDHKVLSGLLEPYHDLQMRYEGMKDYKQQYVIDDYFDKFIDRATRDPMRPFILDLVN